MTKEEEQIIQGLSEVQDALQLFPALQKGLEKLESQIRVFEKNSPKSAFLRKAMSKSSKKPKPTGEELDVTGSRIAKYSSLQEADGLVQLLHEDPFNSQARINLVESLNRKATDSSLILMRDAYLLAMLEVEGKTLSAAQVRLAMITQKEYIKRLSQYISNPNTGGSDPVSIAKKAKGSRFLKEVSNTFRYRNISGKNEAIKIQTLEKKKNIPLDEMELYGPILEGLTVLPLAKKNRKIVMDALQASIKKNPVTGYYLSSMHRTYAKYLVISHASGNKGVADECKKSLEASLDSIKKTIPSLAKGGTHNDVVVCFREYGLVCQAFLQYAPRVGLNLNSDHIKLMEHSAQLLEKISSERGISELRAKLLKGISNIQDGTGKKQKLSPEQANQEKADEETPGKAFFKGDVVSDEQIGGGDGGSTDFFKDR